MNKVLIRKSGGYDLINEINWSADLLRGITPIIDESIANREGRTGRYYFDEMDKCVYYELR